MRILLVHNKYKQAGGEDAVFWSESNLLTLNGHDVEHVIYDNSTIDSLFQKIISAFRIIYNPASARALRLKIQDFNPTIIHVHNFLPLVSPSVFFVAKKNGIPVVLTLHNYRLLCPSAILFFHGQIYEKSIQSVFPWDAIWKGVYRNSRVQTALVALMTATHNILGTWKNKVDCYIALTQFAKGKFEKSALSLPLNKLLVKPNFVEDCTCDEIEREDFFLFVGRLTEEKGIRILLKAASIYNFKFVVVGEGPLSKEVESFARHNPDTTYTGLLPKEAVMNHLRRCKALIFPSTWYEGFPVTIIEAFSAGTPVIASDLGGMKEIIQNGINGLHFKAGDEKDLAAKIIELNEKNDLLKQMSHNARLTYLNNYTPAKNYGQLMDVYKMALKKHEVSNEVPLLHKA